ncbi:hypothetical protein [Occallatibacter riparius]|uniref:DUF4105 domain-containing protein n=1 Tax=Occallatibacter riparius TaxID=1002689 RepID=A0A9J7BI91_9BACT|nr:hypothetical protein [Occallatibacter riparius]UWZ82512.1 hypothetical protein MOP44_18270 [Occallatibacter riparius]
MPLTRVRTIFCVLSVLVILGFSSLRSQAQAALLMEEPYGLFGTLNPTGHAAIYFSRLCAETPVKLRRCEPGEPGAVIARYQGIAGYDWVAMPLYPYLYAVDDAADVPLRVNRDGVLHLRRAYHDEHMQSLGAKVHEGNFVHGGWAQLIGVSYERKIYAFRFDTTEEQDEALMGRLNDSRNHTQFNLLYSNCADFARGVMNDYFPHVFTRTFFPDAGMTTPRQITSKLVHYAKKHPETKLSIFAIPQIPGYRHLSHANMSVSGSLMTTAYAIPIAIFNPYLAGGLFIDYLVRGRFPRSYEHCPTLEPSELAELNDEPRFPPASAAPALQSRVTSTAPQPGAATIEPIALKEAIGSHE